MVEGIESVTTRAIALAMDAAILRQQAIATNIANANTEGYEPIAVNFEAQLEDARQSMHGGGYIAPGSLSGVTPHIERAGSRLSGLSPKVLLDVEVANMAQNAVNYQILARGLSRYYSIMSSAVSDGKK